MLLFLYHQGWFFNLLCYFFLSVNLLLFFLDYLSAIRLSGKLLLIFQDAAKIPIARWCFHSAFQASQLFQLCTSTDYNRFHSTTITALHCTCLLLSLSSLENISVFPKTSSVLGRQRPLNKTSLFKKKNMFVYISKYQFWFKMVFGLRLLW